MGYTVLDKGCAGGDVFPSDSKEDNTPPLDHCPPFQLWVCGAAGDFTGMSGATPE